MKLAGLCAVAEVCGVQTEEERKEDGPLQSACVADHTVRYTTYCGVPVS